MSAALASGHLVDAILALVAVEALVLFVLWQRGERGIAPRDALPMLLAGAFLMLALRLSLTGAGWQAICFCLALGGLAHLVDLNRRWRR
jgi:hypothetical protein